MTVLLDTHAFIWMADSPEKLSAPHRAIIGDNTNELLLSIASLWEIIIKESIGKLTLSRPIIEAVTEYEINGLLIVLPVAYPHLNALKTLPHYHRDPFDRLIIAQAIAEDIPVLTADPAFRLYTTVSLA